MRSRTSGSTSAIRRAYSVLWMTRSLGSPAKAAGTCASRPAPNTRLRAAIVEPSAIRASHPVAAPSEATGSIPTQSLLYSIRTRSSDLATHSR